MGLFNRKKKKVLLERENIFNNDNTINKNNWFEVFSACLGKMMAIQTTCADIVVKNQDWNVDFSRGVISFGDSEFPIQFIGSESASSNTWLWGWENINGFDESLIQVANEAKNKGEEWNLEPLTIEKFELDDIFNGHTISIVACGISDKNLCYYRGPHSGGAIFVAFSDVPEEVFQPIGIEKFSNLTMQCIQNFDVDHKIFIESFLRWNGTKYDWNDNKIVAHFNQDLLIEFEQADDFLRICNIETL